MTHSDGLRDGLPRVLRLSDRGRDDFRAEERERRGKENGPEGQELAGSSLDDPRAVIDGNLSERTGVAPVPETDRVVVRTSASHEHNAEDDQNDNGDDFDRCRDELGFGPNSSSAEVDDPDENEKHRDIHRWVGFLVPVLHDDGSCDDLGRDGDGPRIPCC